MKVHRGYQIKPYNLMPSSYIVATDGKGGSIPSILEGLFTSQTIAIKAVDLYLDNKEETNGGKSSKALKQSGV